ncbi:TetR/AcrR family transcriptional regulator [Actinoallomurus vinaceus]|uniref:TetR/AcrR family transcriptional regulator n=1 Tax=Actinoallomurus vinaceus TaxID=1080074 RepID=UPI0031EAAF54
MDVPRNGKVVRDRLRQAALELFIEHGFDQTTAERIAARAGVTERTYFRHFADKREVLFGAEAELRDELTRALAAVPAHLEPLPALRAAFHEVVPLVERNRPVTELGARVIAATPALQERQLAKWAALVALLTDALTARGVDAYAAQLCAQVGVNVCAIAIKRWMDDPSAGLDAELERAFHELYEASTALKVPG